MLDELGKSLEFEARFESEDIYLLQELAEVAARSRATPLLVVGVLHQAFEHYGEHLTASARKEWAKVQGRFSDVAFLEPPEQQMRLAAQATRALTLKPRSDLVSGAEAAASGVLKLGQAPRALRNDEFLLLAREAAPLHPAVLLALPHLFRRFAQNERSLFAYLLSGEPHALPDLWRSKHALVRLSDLFDYFLVNLLGSLSRQAFARRWLEVVDWASQAKLPTEFADDGVATCTALLSKGLVQGVRIPANAVPNSSSVASRKSHHWSYATGIRTRLIGGNAILKSGRGSGAACCSPCQWPKSS